MHYFLEKKITNAFCSGHICCILACYINRMKILRRLNSATYVVRTCIYNTSRCSLLVATCRKKHEHVKWHAFESSHFEYEVLRVEQQSCTVRRQCFHLSYHIWIVKIKSLIAIYPLQIYMSQTISFSNWYKKRKLLAQ